MNNLEERIISIKQKITEAERRKARAEVQREQAKGSFKTAVGKLQSTFQVASIDDAKELLEGVQIKLDVVVSSVEDMLCNIERE